MALNNVNLMGRMTRDPEIRHTDNGTPVASFTLAVERDFKSASGEKETDFIDCTAWRKTGVFIDKYFKKGDGINVVGRMESEKYTDKDGNAVGAVYDLVVLSIGLNPPADSENLSKVLGVNLNEYGFCETSVFKPLETSRPGILVSGAFSAPKDIPTTVSQASAAAAKVIGLLCKDKLTGNPCVAGADELMCSGCSVCGNVCPYGAITYTEKEFRMPDRTTKVRRVAQVNPAVCQGCGACTVVCPSGAMDLNGFKNNQIMAEVDAICRN